MNFSKREFVFGVVILLLLIIVSLSFFSPFDNDVQEDDDFYLLFEDEAGAVKVEDEPVVLEDIYFVVDVKGAILQPGVYEVVEGMRVVDAIEMAGGFLEEADVNKINLAALLQDEMVIYIPTEGEEMGEQMLVQPIANSQIENGKVNLNVATAEELVTLPGIGPAKAQAIIAYREEHGLFKQVEDLLQVSGIGAKSLEQMIDELYIK